MPAAPRQKNLGTKVAYKILGKPASMKNKLIFSQRIREKLNADNQLKVR